MSETLIESGFDALGVSPNYVEMLARQAITTPTPIQAAAIPVALAGKDVMGIAQTGTGKTLAFALPVLERMKPHEQALVLSPTRELAHQTAFTFAKIGGKPALVVGGESIQMQIHALRKKPPVIVATPGRLIDHLRRGTVRLDNIKFVVLDEADRMLDMGFAPDIERILGEIDDERQTLLFSATIPPEIEQIATNYMQSPERIETARSGSRAELVSQEVVYLQHSEKYRLLEELLLEHDGRILVFTRTKHGARKLAESLREIGHKAVEMHADRTMLQRRQALQGFSANVYRVMVATDVAARGIDVNDIELVINFDVPEQAEDYVHRIGRSGRAGATGKSVTLALRPQGRMIRAIEEIIGETLPISDRSTENAPVVKFKRGHAKRDLTNRPEVVHSPHVRPERPERYERPVRADDFVIEKPRVARSSGAWYDAEGNVIERAQPAPRPAYNRDDRPRPYNREDRPQYPRRDDNGPRPYNREDRPQYPRRDDRPRPYNRDDRPQYPRRDDSGPRPYNRDDRPQYPRRDDSGPRPYNREDRPQYPRRDDNGPRPYNRDDRPQYPRRDDNGPRPYNRDDRPQYPRRDDNGPRPYNRDDRPQYPRRDDNGPRPYNREDRPHYPRRDDRPRPYNRDDRPQYPRRDDNGPRPYKPRPYNPGPDSGRPAKKDRWDDTTAPRNTPFEQKLNKFGGSAKPKKAKPGKLTKFGKPAKNNGMPSNGFQPPKKRHRKK